ncbi:MAG TPA: hypothetical protein VL126_11365 [Bacteroidota bacterium]|nr:hypothetical protein [Bacteroidota bacterium]
MNPLRKTLIAKFPVALLVLFTLAAPAQEMRSATHVLKPPYLKRAGRRGPMTIWIVDGSYIRTNIDEEFTNFGQHYTFSYIPEKEFWIDREGKPDEYQFFVDHLLTEYHLMARGVSYDSALATADRQELQERKEAGDVAKMTEGGNLPDPRKVHVRLWKHLASGVNVWIVDGRLVRSVFDVDFTEGGHDYVYEFVPDGEVWIDNDLQTAERPYVLLHELHERNLMAKGWDYDRAHEDASRIELRCRHNPNELHMALGEEGWE